MNASESGLVCYNNIHSSGSQSINVSLCTLQQLVVARAFNTSGADIHTLTAMTLKLTLTNYPSNPKYSF